MNADNHSDIKAHSFLNQEQNPLSENMKVAVFVIIVSVLSGSWTLPLTQKEKRDIVSGSDPSADQSPIGCFVTREDVRIETK